MQMRLKLQQEITCANHSETSLLQHSASELTLSIYRDVDLLSLFFLLGGRQCICEHLARLEQFMMLVTIIQNFHLELAQEEFPTLKGAVKTLGKAPLRIILSKRR